MDSVRPSPIDLPSDEPAVGPQHTMRGARRGGPRSSFRRHRIRSLLLSALLIALVAGVFSSEYFFDEPPPETSDLAAPLPRVGAIDPFKWFEKLPGGRQLDPDSMAIISNSALVGQAVGDAEVGGAEDGGAEALRGQLRSWFTSFESEFARSGGDPNSLAQPQRSWLSTGDVVVWTGTDETHPADRQSASGGVPPLVTSASPSEILLAAAELESVFGTGDQAFGYLDLALRVQTWILSYYRGETTTKLVPWSGRDPYAADLSSVLLTVIQQIEAGRLSMIESDAVLDALAAWELPNEAFDGITARFFRARCLELESADYWRTVVGHEPPEYRFKMNRTKRRLAESIREVREHLMTPGIVGDAETAAWVRVWIDPYGDEVLEEQLEALAELRVESFIDPWLEGKLVRWAIAIHRFERVHGSPPASLEALVPEFLPALPAIPGASEPPSYDEKTRTLRAEIEGRPRSIVIPGVQSPAAPRGEEPQPPKPATPDRK